MNENFIIIDPEVSWWKVSELCFTRCIKILDESSWKFFWIKLGNHFIFNFLKCLVVLFFCTKMNITTKWKEFQIKKKKKERKTSFFQTFILVLRWGAENATSLPVLHTRFRNLYSKYGNTDPRSPVNTIGTYNRITFKMTHTVKQPVEKMIHLARQFDKPANKNSYSFITREIACCANVSQRFYFPVKRGLPVTISLL